MYIRCKNGETVNSQKQYYQTEHWANLTKTYTESPLSNLCCKCRKSYFPSHFYHRTKKRIGNERLNDIMPVCQNCLDKKVPLSKKKAERRQLAPFGFNPSKLSGDQKNWLISIKPHIRGYVLTKLYAQNAQKYKPSNFWVNAQVKKACKWIHKQEKELLQEMYNNSDEK